MLGLKEFIQQCTYCSSNAFCKLLKREDNLFERVLQFAALHTAVVIGARPSILSTRAIV